MVSTRSRSSSSKRNSSSSPSSASGTRKVEACSSSAHTSAPKRSRPAAKGSKSGSTRFAYDLPYASLDLRTHPHLYRTGIGEQGVLMVEPYKSEILPHWRFRTASIAIQSSSKLYAMFESYIEARDFVGADMARKFIQMGYTRARRYANHKGGKKYTYPQGGERQQIQRLDMPDQDPEKVEAATIFKSVLDDQVWTNQPYVEMREQHIAWAKDQPALTEHSPEVQSAMLNIPDKESERRKR